MRPDWSQVHPEHVRQACAIYDSGAEGPRREAQNTFLLVGRRRYPAKFIRGLAYRVATGTSLDPSKDFAGGAETAAFFRGLGFDVEYRGGQLRRRESHDNHKDRSGTAEVNVRSRVRPADQRNALGRALKCRFGVVETEKGFDWLVVPSYDGMSGPIERLFQALRSVRGHSEFLTPGRALRCDFFLPNENVIIEYDERQHFTAQRAVALRLYPDEVALGFEKQEWIGECERIRAIDPWPEDRDEQRAFYDSLRDILSAQMGIALVRIRHGAFDWTQEGADAHLDRVLSQFLPPREAVKTAGRYGVPCIATVCVEGQPSRRSTSRAELVREVVEGLEREDWRELDCIVFPGGFFHLPIHVGHLPYDERARVISESNLSGVCRDACCRLNKGNPGLIVVAGVDSVRRRHNRPGGADQLCVAWDGTGVVGIGRKVFPIGDEGFVLICHAEDYRTDRRVVSLPSGRRAVLCACYDMFGCSEKAGFRGARTGYIRNIEIDGVVHNRSRGGFAAIRDRCIAEWNELLARNEVTIAIGAIHGFERPGLDTFWQRHGIAACSAALDGGLAIAAAHFTVRLPDAHRSTLASVKVPSRHLAEGHDRQAHRMRASRWFSLDGALVRLFMAR